MLFIVAINLRVQLSFELFYLVEKVPLDGIEMLLTMHRDVTLLPAEVAHYKYRVVVMRWECHLLVYFIVSLGGTSVLLQLSCFNKAFLVKTQNFSKATGASCRLAIKVREKGNFPEIFINLQLFDVSVSTFLDNHNVAFGNKVHFSAPFILLKYVIIHAVCLIYQQKGDLWKESEIEDPENSGVF